MERMGNVCKILVGNRDESWWLERTGLQLDDNIDMFLKGPVAGYLNMAMKLRIP
jgi:hypothetical protein